VGWSGNRAYNKGLGARVAGVNVMTTNFSDFDDFLRKFGVYLKNLAQFSSVLSKKIQFFSPIVLAKIFSKSKHRSQVNLP
jgi:pyruvoyl-dependent arginine decarboxylase (PvlArgDC)